MKENNLFDSDKIFLDQINICLNQINMSLKQKKLLHSYLVKHVSCLI